MSVALNPKLLEEKERKIEKIDRIDELIAILNEKTKQLDDKTLKLNEDFAVIGQLQQLDELETRLLELIIERLEKK